MELWRERMKKRMMDLFTRDEPELALSLIPTAQKTSEQEGDTERMFSESELDAAIREAQREARDQAIFDVGAEFRQAERAASSRELAKWFDRKRRAGEIAASWEKLGLLEFMQSLDGVREFQFSEWTEAQSPAAWMKGFIDEINKLIPVSRLDSAMREAQ